MGVLAVGMPPRALRSWRQQVAAGAVGMGEAVAYLTGAGSRHTTGTDLLVDGGQAAWIRWHMPPPSAPTAPE